MSPAGAASFIGLDMEMIDDQVQVRKEDLVLCDRAHALKNLLGDKA